MVMFNTIKGKITTGLILISFTILIIINIFIWKIFENNLHNYILNDMEKIRSIVHYELERQTVNSGFVITAYNRNNLWSVMNSAALQYNAFLSIKYDMDDYVQFAGEVIDKGSMDQIIKDSGYESSLLYLHNNGNNYYATYSYPVYLKDKYVGTFVFQKDYYDQYSNYRNLIMRIIGIQSVLFVIMIIINYIWLKRSTNSLNTLLEGINSIGDGEFSKKLEAKSNDEVAIIIKHFNRMQDKIASQMERLQQEKAKIEKLEKSTRNFFNYATHEMKTPITSITGYAQLLKEGKIDEETKKRAYDRIITESIRMNKLVQNMLIIARGKEIEKGHNEYIQLNELLIKIVKEYEMILNNVKIEADITDEDVVIYSNKEEIRAIVLNLLDNATKYSVDGKIKIKLKMDKNAYIIVENKTRPLPDEIRSNLFEPFVKYNFGDQRQASSGLGLYICKELAKKNKGDIYYSIKDDIISFIVEFPVENNKQIG